MISRAGAAECIVYIVPPGEESFVTAGRFAVGTGRRDVPVGRFVYDRSYLERPDAVPLDPVELGLATRTYETVLLKGMFGALRDASPDYWGRRLIGERSGEAQLEEVDYLLLSPDDRAGALGFALDEQPPVPRKEFNHTTDLERLQAVADAISTGAEPPANAEAPSAQDLLLAVTAIGGARPKGIVEDDGALWIAKLNRQGDHWNHARVEHAMLVLARECGLRAAETRLARIGDRDALLVKRFDRQRTEQGYRRARMISALTLLRAGDGDAYRERLSYPLLAEELRRISTRPRVDALELFRRMCFNALISNTDDHARNHAVIALDSEWRLSPAYDLTPFVPPVGIERRDLALTCGDLGRYAHAENLLSQSARFLLSAEDARRILDDMEERVRNRWHDVARKEGVSEADCERIAGAFDYAGFRLPAGEQTAPCGE